MFNFLYKILNLEGHLNCFIGLKVTAILVNGGILRSGGVTLGRVCAGNLRRMLVTRPGVAGAVLQTASYLIQSFIK